MKDLLRKRILRGTGLDLVGGHESEVSPGFAGRLSELEDERSGTGSGAML
jgi:hypothetical protein